MPSPAVNAPGGKSASLSSGNKANPFDNQLPKQLFFCRDISLNWHAEAFIFSGILPAVIIYRSLFHL
jgi:hypothetical protein